MSNYKNGGEAIVDALTSENVNMIFGVPGRGELNILNALYDKEDFSFISTYYENSAALMAETHGRLTGEPGICVNIAGPGSVNTMNGIAQAFTNSSPVVQIAGDFRTGDRVLSYHGVDDFDFTLKLFEPITKWSVRIKRTEDIPKILSKAFNVAKSGRPGPVHLQIPPEVLFSKAELIEYRKTEVVRNGAPDYLIDEAIDILKKSSRPVIYTGLGVARSFASSEIMELAELLGAPVGTTRPASDVVSYDHPLSIGNSHHLEPNVPNVCNEIMAESDTVITVGTGMGGGFTVPLKRFENVIHVDYGENLDYNRVVELSDFEPRTKLFGDIKTILKQLIGKLDKKKPDKHKLKGKISSLKEKLDRELESISSQKGEPIHPFAVISDLRRSLDEDAILCADVGSSCRWVSRFKSFKPHTLLISGRWDSMGTGLATSLSAKLLNPDKQVVLLAGDGGFLMAPMELGTAVKYGLDVVVVIMHNSVLGSIWRHQNRLFPGRNYATELYCPDFVRYAESFGAEGIRVSKRAELKKAINEGLKSKVPVVIDVNSDHCWTGVDYPRSTATVSTQY
jgi:acetolactate synthase-1/2/3 large subunit